MSQDKLEPHKDGSKRCEEWGGTMPCTHLRSFQYMCLSPFIWPEELRLYNGISRPLAVLSAENTKLIEMQAASVAAVPSKSSRHMLKRLSYTCETWTTNHLPGTARTCSSKDSLKWPKLTVRWTCTWYVPSLALNSHVFHECEFLQAHVRAWKPPESEEAKAAKAAERAEKAKHKKKAKKELDDNGMDVKSQEDSAEPKCRPWHMTNDKH